MVVSFAGSGAGPGARAEMGVAAVLFDLDGTLMDSEVLTDRAIALVMAARGVPDVLLPPTQTRGRTWQDIAAALCARYPQVVSTGGAALAEALAARWLADGDAVMAIPGAPAAVRAAAAHLRVAVVSSSPRAVIQDFLARLGIGDLFPASALVGAEDVARGKPAPDPYLLAAARLAVVPERCLVFEDASAGLVAARAANMARVLVLHACAEPERCRALADYAITDYRILPAELWAQLAEQGLAALTRGRS